MTTRAAGALALTALLTAAGCGTTGVAVDQTRPTVTLFADDGPDVAVPDSSVGAPTGPAVAGPERRAVPDARRSALGVVFRHGVALPVLETDDTGWTAQLPCGDELAASSPAPERFVVMADAGGDAAADGASVELAAAVTEAVADELRSIGVATGTTRPADADVAVAHRVAAVEASGARVVVSVLVGGEADGEWEVVPRAADDDSIRLAHAVAGATAEVLDPLATPAAVADRVRVVLNQRGDDYFGALRGDARVAAVVLRMAPDGAAPDDGVPAAAPIGRAIANAVYDHLTLAPAGGRPPAPPEDVREAPTSPIADCVDPTAGG